MLDFARECSFVLCLMCGFGVLLGCAAWLSVWAAEQVLKALQIHRIVCRYAFFHKRIDAWLKDNTPSEDSST